MPLRIELRIKKNFLNYGDRLKNWGINGTMVPGIGRDRKPPGLSVIGVPAIGMVFCPYIQIYYYECQQ
jgi:hypothetical protein